MKPGKGIRQVRAGQKSKCKAGYGQDSQENYDIKMKKVRKKVPNELKVTII